MTTKKQYSKPAVNIVYLRPDTIFTGDPSGNSGPVELPDMPLSRSASNWILEGKQ